MPWRRRSRRRPGREGTVAEKRDVSPPAVDAGATAIEQWRKRIDLIDSQLVGLLNSREVIRSPGPQGHSR